MPPNTVSGNPGHAFGWRSQQQIPPTDRTRRRPHVAVPIRRVRLNRGRAGKGTCSLGWASRAGPVGGGGQSGGFRSHNADPSDTDCPDSACPTFSPRVAGQPCRASSGSSRQPGDCLGQLPARPGTIAEHPCCPGNRWPKPTALLIGQGHGPGLRQKTRLHRRRFPRKLAGTLYPDHPSCKPARFPLLPLPRPRSCRCC